MPGYREGIDETAENVYYMGISMYFRSTEVVTMARKQDTNMVHCSSCGEDYSATYKFCPFCGGRNAPAAPASGAKASSKEYQFDGQDVFDQPDASPAGKGGKRLAGTGAQRPTPPPPINWPRLITFLCSLVIIAAALVMVFTVVYPHLRGASNPDAAVSPSLSASQDPNASATVGPDGLKGMTLDTVDLTLQSQQSHALVLTFDPVDWEGTVTWSSSDETCATVNEDGVVTNVNASGSQRRVVITATTGSQTVTCTVYCQSSAPVTPAPNTPAPTPSQSVQTGGIAGGSRGTIINASGGLRVRSGPGTDYDVLASLSNGDPITVVSYAGDDWYEIQYAGSNGTKTGYIMGEYISVD